MSKKLTVFLTCYNRQNYIRYALESILNQTYEDFDLIVLNNASTDNTLAVVEEFCDERMRVITHDTNIGGIANINFAVDMAQSKYFMVVHDDDILEPELFKAEVAFLDAHDDYAVVSVQSNIINKDGVVFGARKKLNTDDFSGYSYDKNKYPERCLRGSNMICCPSAMYRTQFLKEYNLRFRKEVGPCCDFIFFSEINMCGGKLYILNNPLIRYRIHNAQDSSYLHDAIDFRIYDSVYKLKQELNSSIDITALSDGLSRNLAFMALRLAQKQITKEQFKKIKQSIFEKEYFIKLRLKDKFICFLGTKMGLLLRMIYRIRAKIKHKVIDVDVYRSNAE